MRQLQVLLVTAVIAFCGIALQGCVAAAAGAGAAGGYQAQKEGYGVQSPVKEDEAGGYKGQNPITHDESKDQTRDNDSAQD